MHYHATRKTLKSKTCTVLDERALLVTTTADRAQLGKVIARTCRCQDARAESHELGAVEARTAWDILQPHVQTLPPQSSEVPNTVPLAVIRVCVTDVNPALRSHSCMIACIFHVLQQ